VLALSDFVSCNEPKRKEKKRKEKKKKQIKPFFIPHFPSDFASDSSFGLQMKQMKQTKQRITWRFVVGPRIPFWKGGNWGGRTWSLGACDLRGCF